MKALSQIVAIILGLSLAAACAGTSPVSGRPANTLGDGRYLGPDEIRESAYRNANALAAIEGLRPWFLRTRRAAPAIHPAIYIDGNRYDDVRDLELLSASVIVEMRLLDPAQARSRFGVGHGAGAIAITTWPTRKESVLAPRPARR
jgi:hypothetical protein